MDIQGIGVGGAIVAFLGFLQKYFNSAEHKKLAELKMRMSIKEECDRYIASMTLEFNSKNKEILEVVAKQTEEVQLLRHSIESLVESFVLLADISKYHIKDEGALEVINNLEISVNKIFSKVKTKNLFSEPIK